MHSSAFGAAARMVFRSFSSAARLSSLKAARYSSMVLGLVFAECISVGLLFSRVSFLQFFDVEFHHFEHGSHDALGFRSVLIAQQLAQNGGHDLPRQTKFVLQPAALHLFSAGGK